MKGINDGVAVSEDLTESISEIVLNGEVVKGSDEITDPVTDSEEEVVSIVDRVLEVFWEHSRESFLGKGSEEENKSEELSDHLGVSLVGALKLDVTLGDFSVELGSGWCGC